jgi:hypothetical protein
MSGRPFAGLGLGFALALSACGRATPEGSQVPRAPHATAAVSPASNTPAADMSTETTTAATPLVPTVEHRVNWYGVSIDLGDGWHDATQYDFTAPQGPLESLAFSVSDIKAEQVRLWLEEVRKRVDGVYGAKPSLVQPFENSNYSVLGVRISIKAESVYDIFVTLEDSVLNINARCRAECDATVRGIVGSLRRLETASLSAPHERSLHSYDVMGLVFDSSQPFEMPRKFALVELGNDPERNPGRVFCSRASSPPEDSALPSDIVWASEANAALAKVPRTEESVTGTPGEAGTPATTRLYRREGYVPDQLGQIVFASSSSAVLAIGSELLTCHLQAVPSSPALLARFHRLFEHARH